MCSTLRLPLSSSREDPAARRLSALSSAMPALLLIRRTSSPALSLSPVPESVIGLAPEAEAAECSSTGVVPVTKTMASSSASEESTSAVRRKLSDAFEATARLVRIERSVTFQ